MHFALPFTTFYVLKKNNNNKYKETLFTSNSPLSKTHANSEYVLLRAKKEEEEEDTYILLTIR